MTYYKTLSAGAVKAAAPDGTATVVIATTGRDGPIDHDGDIVQPGAVGRQTVPILPGHDWTHIWLGKASTVEVGNQVHAALKFNLAVPEAQAWHAALAFDLANPPATAEYSWGYDAEARPGRVGDRAVRFLDRVKLHEVSMVVRGASVGTRTLAVKREDTLSPDSRAELLRIRDGIEAYRLEREAEQTQARQVLAETAHLLEEADKPSGGKMAAARKMATAAAHAAGLSSVPPVRWFTPGRAPGTFSERVQAAAKMGKSLRGFADLEKKEVWIANHLSGRDLAAVICHEVGHLGGREHGEVEYFVEQNVAAVAAAALR